MKKRTFLFALFLSFVTMFSVAQAAASLTDQAATLAKAGNTAAIAKLASDNPTQAAAIASAAAKAAPANAAAIAAAVAKAVPAAALAVITEVSRAVPSAAASIAQAVQTAIPSVSVADAARAASAGSGTTVNPSDVTGPNTPQGGNQTAGNQGGNTPPVDPTARNVSGS